MKHETNNKPIRWNVFIPCFAVIGGSAILGIVNNQWLTAVTNGIFSWSLSTFGWLYQIVAMVTLFAILCIVPLVYMVLVSFADTSTMYIHWDDIKLFDFFNYRYLFENRNFGRLDWGFYYLLGGNWNR